ncbi:hypothetical protein LCGC14_0924500 [marine sediment metagenome]|uniref:Uncharacterized protein n=1 Tax=marine sediment metagenome TaxID=412755 RepID=A0A0F9RWG0_9ZZZZ
MIKQLTYKEYEPIDLDRLVYMRPCENSFCISFVYAGIYRRNEGTKEWRFDSKKERNLVWDKVIHKLDELYKIHIE